MSSIKLGLAGWGFRELTIREYFDTASRLGLPLVELNCRADVPGHAWVDYDQQDVTEVLDCAADQGIEIAALAAQNDFTQSDPVALNSQVAQLRRTIELAGDLKAKYVRIIVGLDAEPGQAVLETALRKLQEAGQFADSLGIKLAVENGTGPVRTTEQCLELMQELSAFPIGLVYNPAGLARDGNDPVQALDELAEHVCFSHLADWDGTKVCAVGKGQIDWQTVLGLLEQAPAELAFIEYPHPQDVELGTAASQKKLASLLRRLKPNPH